MQKNMTDRTPGSYDDFVAYLGTVRTEEELFSRLTYWFAGQNRPEDVLSRSELVEARAKELGFWQGLTFRMERWLTDGKSELEAVGREEFQSRIAEDYAAYREKADAARARFRDRRRAAPFNFTPDCLQNVPIQNVSWLVDGLLPIDMWTQGLVLVILTHWVYLVDPSYLRRELDYYKKNDAELYAGTFQKDGKNYAAMVTIMNGWW